jgi:hypothetical protein
MMNLQVYLRDIFEKKISQGYPMYILTYPKILKVIRRVGIPLADEPETGPE